ncbi:MAG: hypothetical protein ACD_75C00175G0001 [uncultured bacterium]|nr:MAG: hypothetical protein ACD_75C00175G0001 [uncultured bacterium]
MGQRHDDEGAAGNLAGQIVGGGGPAPAAMVDPAGGEDAYLQRFVSGHGGSAAKKHKKATEEEWETTMADTVFFH